MTITYPMKNNERKDSSMDVSKIVAEIDAKISSLQQARAVLLNLNGDNTTSQPRRGRPRGKANTAKPSESRTIASTSKRKRTLSPEGRKAIAEAMKRRWADRRKAAATSGKKVSAKTQP